MPPRTSLKKHDAATESRALKAQRQRISTQIRKDKRRATVQTKRRRVMSMEQGRHTDRSITELVRVLGDTTNASSAHSQARFETLKEIRVLLARHEHDYEQVDQIIESGIVPVLVSLLNSASPLASATRTGGEVYSEILWCLTNIASGQYEHTKVVLPAVPRLLQFLETSTPSLAENAAWVIGNIAADCDEFRQHLIAAGAVKPLVALLRPLIDTTLTQKSVWALSNLARGVETSSTPFVDAGIVSILLNPQTIGKAFSDAFMIEVAWLLSFLSAREEATLQLLLTHGLIAFFMPSFTTTKEELLTPILRVFGNICCSSIDHHTDEWQKPYIHRLVCEDSVMLPKLYEFLQPQASHVALAAEAAWVISNLAATDTCIVDRLIHAQLLPLLSHHFHHGTYLVRREVAFALTNVALTSVDHMNQIVELHVVTEFLQLLSVSDVALVGNSLRFLEQLMRGGTPGVALVEAHGGIDALEKVQFENEAEYLSTWAAALVNEFYGENYGVQSPPLCGKDSLTEESTEIEIGTSNAVVSGGRGRGVHMTMPAWKEGTNWS
ncbi:hypothetical protein CCR75_007615 [Bremia lactucae]|uniref:Importin subunit alpha n=1 Tax=Bremia lactucae TaxID=4779 RepID=A0A976ILN7_BRELC|nr:hypothetical protein CCR75_007615 [Bremia lactucae]